MDPTVRTEPDRLLQLARGGVDERELVELFAEAASRLAQLLARDLAAGRLDAVRQHADALVGVAEAVGASELSALAAGVRIAGVGQIAAEAGRLERAATDLVDGVRAGL